MFRQIRHRAKDFCSGLRHLLRRKPYDRKTNCRLEQYLNTTIRFDRSPFDEPFSLTGVDRLLMMVHNDLYRKALTVKQLPEIYHLVALQPDRFRGSDEAIMPEEIGRNKWNFAVLRKRKILPRYISISNVLRDASVYRMELEEILLGVI